MSFNKVEFLKEAEDLLEKSGKPSLKEFLEDAGLILWDIVKLAAKHSGVAIIMLISASMDGTVKGMIDKIDGKEG